VPQLAPHQLLPAQRSVQPPGRAVDGVTLGHGDYPAGGGSPLSLSTTRRS
jgi:hypothetical protein